MLTRRFSLRLGECSRVIYNLVIVTAESKGDILMSTVTLEQLTNRLGQLESEIAAIRHALTMLQAGPVASVVLPLADKTSLSEQMQQLLQQFSIVGQPAGPEPLQKQMAQSNLSRNELSQSLIEARGE
jgi:hypothetical protein